VLPDELTDAKLSTFLVKSLELFANDIGVTTQIFQELDLRLGNGTVGEQKLAEPTGLDVGDAAVDENHAPDDAKEQAVELGVNTGSLAFEFAQERDAFPIDTAVVDQSLFQKAGLMLANPLIDQ